MLGNDHNLLEDILNLPIDDENENAVDDISNRNVKNILEEMRALRSSALINQVLPLIVEHTEDARALRLVSKLNSAMRALFKASAAETSVHEKRLAPMPALHCAFRVRQGRVHNYSLPSTLDVDAHIAYALARHHECVSFLFTVEEEEGEWHEACHMETDMQDMANHLVERMEDARLVRYVHFTSMRVEVRDVDNTSRPIFTKALSMLSNAIDRAYKQKVVTAIQKVHSNLTLRIAPHRLLANNDDYENTPDRRTYDASFWPNSKAWNLYETKPTTLRIEVFAACINDTLFLHIPHGLEHIYVVNSPVEEACILNLTADANSTVKTIDTLQRTPDADPFTLKNYFAFDISDNNSASAIASHLTHLATSLSSEFDDYEPEEVQQQLGTFTSLVSLRIESEFAWSACAWSLPRVEALDICELEYDRISLDDMPRCCPNVRELHIRCTSGNYSPKAFSHAELLQRLKQLTSLTLSGFRTISLSFLAKSMLDRLHVQDAPQLETVKVQPSTMVPRLKALQLTNCPQLHDITPLRKHMMNTSTALTVVNCPLLSVV